MAIDGLVQHNDVHMLNVAHDGVFPGYAYRCIRGYFNEMRYINLRFTYLLTYLGGRHICASIQSSS